MVCENSIECGPYPIRIFSSDTGSRPQKHECSRCFIAVGRLSPSGKSVQRSVGTSPDAKCLSILCFDIAMTVPLRYDLACRRRCLVPMPPCGCANEPVKGRPTFSVFRAATASGAGHLAQRPRANQVSKDPWRAGRQVGERSGGNDFCQDPDVSSKVLTNQSGGQTRVSPAGQCPGSSV